MQQSIIDRTQEVLWRHLGDAVKVFTPGADVDSDDPVWTGLAIRMVPDGVDAPDGEVLSYQQPVRSFAFRISGAPALPQRAIILYGGVSWLVDQVPDVGNERIEATVFPDES